MFAARAGKISVTVMKERKREEKIIYFHLKQWKTKFSPSMHVLNNINFLILNVDVLYIESLKPSASWWLRWQGNNMAVIMQTKLLELNQCCGGAQASELDIFPTRLW